MSEEKEKPPIAKLYGWWDKEKGSISMVFPSRVQVEMCSPDGFKSEIEAGKGDIVEFYGIHESHFPISIRWVDAMSGDLFIED